MKKLLILLLLLTSCTQPVEAQINVVGSTASDNLNGFGWFDFSTDYKTAICTAISSQRVVSMDISNPSAPVELHSIIVPGAEGIEVEGNVAYVGSYAANAGLYAVDISNPSLMTVLDSNSADANFSYTVTTAIVGDYVFCGNYGGGFNKITAVNKSDPTNLSVAGTYSHATNANQVIYLKNVKGKLYCSCRGSNTFVIFSVSGYTLTPDDSITTELSNPAGFSVTDDGNLVAIASRDDDEIVLYDTSDTTNILYLGKYTGDAYLNYPMVPYIYDTDNILCTAYLSNSFEWINSANKASPVLIDYITDATVLKGVDDLKYNPNDGYFYLAANTGKNLIVVDIPSLTSRRTSRERYENEYRLPYRSRY